MPGRLAKLDDEGNVITDPIERTKAARLALAKKLNTDTLEKETETPEESSQDVIAIQAKRIKELLQAKSEIEQEYNTVIEENDTIIKANQKLGEENKRLNAKQQQARKQEYSETRERAAEEAETQRSSSESNNNKKENNYNNSRSSENEKNKKDSTESIKEEKVRVYTPEEIKEIKMAERLKFAQEADIIYEPDDKKKKNKGLGNGMLLILAIIASVAISWVVGGMRSSGGLSTTDQQVINMLETQTGDANKKITTLTDEYNTINSNYESKSELQATINGINQTLSSMQNQINQLKP
jgi:hypothetical protein